uniref:GH18 domain-containing protein n=1 Tax=Anopheles farauti TaxID=69004 RepID=A0A182QR09_9DIPT
MREPRWMTLHTTVSYLTWTVVVVTVFGAFGGVSRVHSLPCGDQGSAHLAKIVCFISASNEHYDYDSLRTGLCSHIVLIDLMGVGKDGFLEVLQTSSRSLNRFTRLKRHFSDVGDEAKFIISIGGVAQKSVHFSRALKTVQSRCALSDELISFIIKHNLDGIDIAWFYPAQFGGAESDRTNLVVFLRDLHLRTKACAITLSLTVGVDPKDIELSYDVPRINEVVDFVNLLTSDYHNPAAPTHISPLYGQGPRDRLNINYSVMSYIEAGLNPRKIIIMSSCYAYLYVSKINKEDPTCSAKLRTVMRLSYLSARELITRETLQTSWDDMRHVPYGTVTNGGTKKWLTYNDVESIKRKADYALHYQLGGMGLFSVDEDDYGGRDGCGRYPMLRAIVSIIYPELDCTEEDTEDIEHIICPYTGYMTDPDEPECYYVCQQGLNLNPKYSHNNSPNHQHRLKHSNGNDYVKHYSDTQRDFHRQTIDGDIQQQHTVSSVFCNTSDDDCVISFKRDKNDSYNCLYQTDTRRRRSTFAVGNNLSGKLESLPKKKTYTV